LLETLVGLTIFAVSLTALFGAYANGLKAARTNERHTHAQILAQSLLEQATAGRQLPPVSSSGSNDGFRWRINARPASARLTAGLAASEWQLYRVGVVVNWDRNRTFKLDTLRLARVRR